MPDRRSHRGPHPEDLQLFDPACWPLLQQAVHDICWLLTRGYPDGAATKLVGDRYSLSARQRVAVQRCSCSDSQRADRQSRQVQPDLLRGRAVWLDGYNVLTTIEAALAGAVILPGHDGCYRDMASMHGSYRKVEETAPALELLGQYLAQCATGPCTWYFDQPVSNSGRLKTILQHIAAEHAWPWQAQLVPNPDPLLAASSEIIVTADSAVLDAGPVWFNLAREVVQHSVPEANVVRLA